MNPWEMTQSEWLNQNHSLKLFGFQVKYQGKEEKRPDVMMIAKQRHRSYVWKAIVCGHHVPEKVLQDYPLFAQIQRDEPLLKKLKQQNKQESHA